ncbi:MULTISPECIES: filamentous hemagglutinin N-terminal domain-containing protein [unclassified Caballeronia]|uniref:two-partner secretion domain-containing protein n=1 Tax=unclassified Caballeronia TaxID=2646786 RepID=UPI00286480B8|nr:MULTISPECIES: filamentous hemagglutinin N-terminal domain-containing protein [unclassified Caballeronia]MDR5753357.1 filamentous hemagglutinin N-terminal domain-containing protein [Caballeronia sp. LZ024]MDR5841096.1 filamentous hemagglutinin N-terminal domain-containing protein [Caballeronia sp. LZ031]
MNKNNYRLVFSRLRKMLVAVDENVAATGKEAGQSTLRTAKLPRVTFSLRQIAFAALALLGALPSWSGAQIVAGDAHAPSVIQTQNGRPQVNINRPSGAGVSMNTYGQFDVQQKGAILNNSPTIMQTQQAGMINGNPNFAAGQSARVIVNQVNSGAASQINGHLEVAGQRAEVVIANGSGISVNGGGFINTSRAILTTGTPNFAADGSLAGFNVTGGNITVQGAGLDARDTDQVDLPSRAVQANAAIYAKNLNVVTGANSVNHDTLDATPISGDGPAHGVSIDVSQLGGMYANRIVLVGTEQGVGVSTKGVLAAQSGDLTLTTQGKLVLAGQTNASGNINVSARDGIDNSGTTYAQQNVTANTSGALTNSGVLSAQKNATVKAGNVASTGTLGAGVNGDGSLASSGDLSVTAGDTLSATGRNAAGGNAAMQGASLNLAGGQTSANGNHAGNITAGGSLNLSADQALNNQNGTLSGASATVAAASIDNSSGDIEGDALSISTPGDLVNRGGTLTQYAQANQSVSVGGTFDNAKGTLASNATNLNLKAQRITNDIGTIQHAGRGALTLKTTGAVSNASGQMTTNGALALQAGGAIDNRHGVMRSAGGVSLNAASLDNTAGRIVSLNGDGLTLTTSGALVNAPGASVSGDPGGVIGANGNLAVNAGTLSNQAQFNAAGNATVLVGVVTNC